MAGVLIYLGVNRIFSFISTNILCMSLNISVIKKNIPNNAYLKMS